MWMGGTAVSAANLGPGPNSHVQLPRTTFDAQTHGASGRHHNAHVGAEAARWMGVEKHVVAGTVSADALKGHVEHWQWDPRGLQELRPDVYDELLKLPLRYQMHPFDRLAAHQAAHSTVGYAPPLGPADAFDTIPFYAHRLRSGNFNMKVRSLDVKNALPVFKITLNNIDGDVFRMEDELIKIFPTKKTFVNAKMIRVFNAAEDARVIMHHWLLGLGF
jgi:hypothetical protein